MLKSLFYGSLSSVVVVMACNDSEPSRVMLWSCPRSRSTAVLRSISNVQGGVCYCEPYMTAFLLGPESKVPSAADPNSPEDLPGSDLAYDSSIATFAWVKQTLEATHPNTTRLIFVKDFAFCLGGKMERLPRGYRHTFLIRNPRQVVPSWIECNKEFRPPNAPPGTDGMDEWNRCQMGKHAGYDDLLGVYEYIRENIDPRPFVMDADDLVSQPESVMRAYCEAAGISFTKTLVEWEDTGMAINAKWIACRQILRDFQFNYHLNINLSSKFMKSQDLFKPPRPESSLSPEVLEYIQGCMPFYEKLYDKRFVPQA